jgi:phosphohistidine phosphatase
VDVFLIRHAAAIDETLELRDPMRHLTADGRLQAVALGDRLRWHDYTPTQIWTSPLVRAVQTAELVAAGLKASVPVDVVPLLAPGESARALLARVQALPSTASVILVGHEPGLSGLGALLAGAPDFAALAKAEAVRLVDGTTRWRCAWNSEAPTR